ncbi:MAG: class I SAM-dependent methyltransferase [Pontixanthobacter sp.]
MTAQMPLNKQLAPAGGNIDHHTVDGFGEEWAAYDQTAMSQEEWEVLFDAYFHIFPFDTLPQGAEGFDMGCGSGRWADGVAPKVGTLHCVDPASKALDVARRRMARHDNTSFHECDVDHLPFDDGSQDFGYSLGVLHHIPETLDAMRSCTAKLKPDAPFLVYLYYAFDNRPAWFRALWKISEAARYSISRMPFGLRKFVTSVIAGTVYWPMTRIALLLEALDMDVSNFPLAPYRKWSFYTMRTDALDRFGTKLEQRFTRMEIAAMMEASGLENVRFSDRTPFWVACGTRKTIV